MPEKSKKKLCFIAHEFGFFTGHGGVAAYLYNIVRMLLDRYDYDIYVLAQQYAPNDPLLKKIHLLKFNNDDECLLRILKEIKPDFVECVEYFSFGYRAMLQKALGLNFRNTIFILNHHTNMRECFMWSEELPLELAPLGIQIDHLFERAKARLADMNIAPCSFMQKYLERQYGYKDIPVVPYVYSNKLKSKQDCAKLVAAMPDLPRDTFNIFYIARFEGRKKQSFLVEQFIKAVSEHGLKANLYLGGNTMTSAIDGIDVRASIYASIPDEYKSMIHFYDFLSLKQQEQILGIADLYVMASTFENFPFSAIDVIYRNIPVMCSKYCGISDVMGDTKDLMTFDPFDPSDLANKLAAFEKLSDEARAKISETQTSTMQQTVGPSSLTAKVDRFFTNKQALSYIDATDIGCTFITEDDCPTDSASSRQTHAVLFPVREQIIEKFLAGITRLSPKMKEAVLVFYKDTAPLSIEEALEDGCAIALLATEPLCARGAYKTVIERALAQKTFFPVNIDYTHRTAQKFHGFALRANNKIDLEDLYHD